MKMWIGPDEWVNFDNDGLFDWVLAEMLYEQPFRYTRDESEWCWLMDEISTQVYDEALYISEAIDYYRGIGQ